MSGTECATLPRPQMRGLLHRQIRTNLVVAIGLATLVGIGMKVFVCEAKKKKYAEFYKNYDAQKSFERMRKAGLFQSVS